MDNLIAQYQLSSPIIVYLMDLAECDHFKFKIIVLIHKYETWMRALEKWNYYIFGGNKISLYNRIASSIISQFLRLETILKLNLFKYKTLFEVLFINCGMGHGMPGVVSLPLNYLDAY